MGRRRRTCFIFTVARTRIRRKFCTRTHEKARPNHQKEAPSVNRCTPEIEKARPNHQKEAPSVNCVHARTKEPVRTVRQTQRRQSLYIHAQNIPSEPSDTDNGVNHVHARTKEPVRTVRYGQRRQSCTRKHEIARPNHQIRTKASMVVPLNTSTRVTVLQNHEGVMLFFARGPTWPASDAAGAASHLAHFSCVSCAVSRGVQGSCQRRA